MMENDESEGAPAVIVHPHPSMSRYWPSENFLPIWDRALAVLDLASGATNGQCVTNYSLHVLGGFWNYFDSNDAINLPKNPKVYYPMFSECLTSISLHLVAVGYMSRFMELGGNGQVQAFLARVPQLQNLSLAMDPSSIRGFVDLENLLGTRVWRFLRSVHIEGFGFREDHFADLFQRHQGTLTRIELVHVGQYYEICTSSGAMLLPFVSSPRSPLQNELLTLRSRVRYDKPCRILEIPSQPRLPIEFMARDLRLHDRSESGTPVAQITLG